MKYFFIFIDGAGDPALTPVTWISKWVDYSDWYGLGYRLSGGCGMGILFNDETRLLMHEDKKYVATIFLMFSLMDLKLKR